MLNHTHLNQVSLEQNTSRKSGKTNVDSYQSTKSCEVYQAQLHRIQHYEGKESMRSAVHQ